MTDPTGEYRPPSDPLGNPPPPPVDPYGSAPTGYPPPPPSGPETPSVSQNPYPVTPPGGYPAPTSGGAPGQASGDVTAYEPPLVTIGDIVVTKNTVQVPHGRYPLRGTTWTVQDSTQVTEEIPAYAIVLAIVFALFCLLGLLFLLIKEKKYSGFVAVSVAGPGFYHSTHLPAGPTTAMWAHDQVNQARALAAAA
ncbi:MAG: hypothetical protein IRY85_18700 [Micromonosporaceae bacterium]|nr:hypothetical protein [Micromonosporaceae bacterium]